MRAKPGNRYEVMTLIKVMLEKTQSEEGLPVYLFHTGNSRLGSAARRAAKPALRTRAAVKGTSKINDHDPAGFRAPPPLTTEGSHRHQTTRHRGYSAGTT